MNATATIEYPETEWAHSAHSTLESIATAETLIRDIERDLAHALRAVTPETWNKMGNDDIEIVMREAVNTPLAGHALSYLPEEHRGAISAEFYVEQIRRGLPGWIVKFATPETQSDPGVQAAVAEWEGQIQNRLASIMRKP